MGKVKNLLLDNNHGVLTHDGVIKVADTHITAKILHIHYKKNGDVESVLVKGNKGSYHCDLHKNIRKSMIFCDIGDTAFVKWKQGKPYFVGFQKAKAEKTKGVNIENTENLNKFMKGVEIE